MSAKKEIKATEIVGNIVKTMINIFGQEAIINSSTSMNDNILYQFKLIESLYIMNGGTVINDIFPNLPNFVNSERVKSSIDEEQLSRIDRYSSNKTTLELLEEYEPTPVEVPFKNDMLNFLKNPNAFERSNLEAHFTGSAWVSTRDGKKALITHHKKLQKKLQLGGHADGDTDILRVAIKEALEESGIKNVHFVPKIFDIDIHVIPARGTVGSEDYVPEHKHYDVRFLIIVENDSNYEVSEESDNLEWIDHSFNCENTGYNFRRLFSKWKKVDFENQDFKETIVTF